MLAKCMKEIYGFFIITDEPYMQFLRISNFNEQLLATYNHKPETLNATISLIVHHLINYPVVVDSKLKTT